MEVHLMKPLYDEAYHVFLTYIVKIFNKPSLIDFIK